MSLKINLSFDNKNYTADLHEPLDLSIPLAAGPNRLSAWYVDPIKIEPVRMGDWVGEVKLGAAVNFRNIFLIHTGMERIQNLSDIYPGKIFQ